jgi:hypothetical protein
VITAVIVISSVLLAALFVWAWISRPAFREQVEYPKHSFQAQLRAYDQYCDQERVSRETGADEAG